MHKNSYMRAFAVLNLMVSLLEIMKNDCMSRWAKLIKKGIEIVILSGFLKGFWKSRTNGILPWGFDFCS